MTASCRTTLTRLAELVDGVLAAPESEALRGHLAICPRCTEFLAAYRGVGSIVARATAVEPPRDLTARILDRWRESTGSR